jgi:transposase
MGNLFWLSDEAWAVIEPHLPRGKPGKPRVDDRRVISGIVHVLKTGCRWRDCPPAYGPPTTIYNRYNRGALEASGGDCSRKSRAQPPCRKNCVSTARTSKPTAPQQAEKGGGSPSDRALARRQDEQNPCFGRSSRPTDCLRADARKRR